jgi:hypothetical protein
MITTIDRVWASRERHLQVFRQPGRTGCHLIIHREPACGRDRALIPPEPDRVRVISWQQER